MKSVLISIQPKWVEKICHEIGKDENGKPIYEKRIEVRKTAPKEVPFKAYIYETYDKKYADIGICWGNGKCFEHGCKKVIGEFICDKVDEYKFHNGLTEFNSMGLPSRNYGSYLIFADDYKAMCLSFDEVKTYGNGKTLYGWCISDLKIYDKPKELSEFRKACPDKFRYCEICKYGSVVLSPDEEEYALYHGGHYDCYDTVCHNIVTRPPQSWCYVEELQ